VGDLLRKEDTMKAIKLSDVCVILKPHDCFDLLNGLERMTLIYRKVCPLMDVDLFLQERDGIQNLLLKRMIRQEGARIAVSSKVEEQILKDWESRNKD
jgi:hypothetical protein